MASIITRPDGTPITKASNFCRLCNDIIKQFGSVARPLFIFASQLSATAYQNVQQARFISELKRADKKQKHLQVQLNHAQKMESVGRLAGGVAHDFNNMLSVILGNAEMILDSVEPGNPIGKKINEIYKAAGRSAELTKQLLAFARKQTIEPRVLNLNRIIRGLFSGYVFLQPRKERILKA